MDAQLALDHPGDMQLTLLGEAKALKSYVVEADAASGQRIWFFIDRETSALRRIEYVILGQRYVETLRDDDASPAGVGRQFHITGPNDGNEVDGKVVRVERPAAIDSSEFHMPPSQSSVEFPAGVTRAILPARFVGQKILIRRSAAVA